MNTAGRQLPVTIKLTPGRESRNHDKYPATIEYNLPTGRTQKKRREEENSSRRSTSIRSNSRGRQQTSREKPTDLTNPKNVALSQLNYLQNRRVKEGSTTQTEHHSSKISDAVGKSTHGQSVTANITIKPQTRLMNNKTSTPGPSETKKKKKLKKVISGIESQRGGAQSSSRSRTNRHHTESLNDHSGHASFFPDSASSGLNNTGLSGAKFFLQAVSKEYDMQDGGGLFSKIKSKQLQAQKKRLATSPSPPLSSSRGPSVSSKPGEDLHSKLQKLFAKTKQVLEAGAKKTQDKSKKKKALGANGSKLSNITADRFEKLCKIDNAPTFVSDDEGEKIIVKNNLQMLPGLAKSNTAQRATSFGSPTLNSKKKKPTQISKTKAPPKTTGGKKKNKSSYGGDTERSNSKRKTHLPTSSINKVAQLDSLIGKISRRDQDITPATTGRKGLSSAGNSSATVPVSKKIHLVSARLQIQPRQLRLKDARQPLVPNEATSPDDPPTFRKVLTRKIKSISNKQRLYQACARKIQRHWRMYKSKSIAQADIANMSHDSSSQSSSEEREPVCMKTSSNNTSSGNKPETVKQKGISQVQNPSKEDIEKRFQKITEENERNFRRFLQSIEKIDNNLPETNSFIDRVQEYKIRAEQCIQMMKSGKKPRVESDLGSQGMGGTITSYVNLQTYSTDNEVSKMVRVAPMPNPIIEDQVELGSSFKFKETPTNAHPKLYPNVATSFKIDGPRFVSSPSATKKPFQKIIEASGSYSPIHPQVKKPLSPMLPGLLGVIEAVSNSSHQGGASRPSNPTSGISSPQLLSKRGINIDLLPPRVIKVAQQIQGQTSSNLGSLVESTSLMPKIPPMIASVENNRIPRISEKPTNPLHQRSMPMADTVADAPIFTSQSLHQSIDKTRRSALQQELNALQACLQTVKEELRPLEPLTLSSPSYNGASLKPEEDLSSIIIVDKLGGLGKDSALDQSPSRLPGSENNFTKRPWEVSQTGSNRQVDSIRFVESVVKPYEEVAPLYSPQIQPISPVLNNPFGEDAAFNSPPMGNHTAKLKFHSNTSKSLNIKELGSFSSGGSKSDDFRVAMIHSPNPDVLAAKIANIEDLTGLMSSDLHSGKDNHQPDSLMHMFNAAYDDEALRRDEIGIVDEGTAPQSNLDGADPKGTNALSEIVDEKKDPKHSTLQRSPSVIQHDAALQDLEVAADEPLFSTPAEKADIITSFILENLIIEAISEDFCLTKFIQILGPHLRHIESKSCTDYLSQMFSQIYLNEEQMQGIVKRLNMPIGHNDTQRLLLASPLLPESEQEAIGIFEYEPVLDIKLYINLEEKFRENEYKTRNLDGFEMEKEHILHKMMFDSLNECLDYKRRGGISGLSLQFSSKFKQPPFIKQNQAVELLDEAKTQVLKWTQMKSGTLMEKEPAFSYSSDHDGLEAAREKIMSVLLNEYVDVKLTEGRYKRFKVERDN